MISQNLIEVFVFLLGVCIGSFLNCAVYRLEQENSFLKGRSYCPNCRHNLNWLDLVPVFSFLFLRGKCRYCKEKISRQYPVVEISTGIIFLLIFNFLNNTANLAGAKFVVYLNLAFLFYVASVLVIIFIYDFKHYLIPDKVLFPAIIITFIYRLFDSGNLIRLFHSSEKAALFEIWDLGFGIFAPLLNYFYAVAIGFGFFLFIFLISKGRWMGFGDVKLAILMGLVLGFPSILVALFLAFFFGAIIGVGLMAFNKKDLKSEIPFGPFLIFGTFAAMLWGGQLIQWYLNLII